MLTPDKSAGTALYQQLYEQLKQQILSEQLTAGQRLPATRELAAEYRLSRNTVTRAYQQLALEGYVSATVGSGYYVERISAFPRREAQPAPPSAPQKAAPAYRYRFSFGDLDYSCYQSKAWRRCLMNAFDQIAASAEVSYGEAQGSPALREALARHLSVARGVNCQAEQIVLTGGHQQSLELLAALFPKNDRTFAMEDPGYAGTRSVMIQNGFSVTPIPLEADGVSLQAVQPLRRTLLYLTPSHQFPLGSVLPVSKRISLLQWAERSGSYIIEDDYDSELRYHNRPIPSLQSLDPHHRTIYLGSFSKSLSPDLRIAYLVLPPELSARYKTLFPRAKCAVSTLFQLALTDFLESGEYLRYIGAMRAHYRKKHDFILNYVRETLSGRVTLLGADGGLHFVFSIKTPLSQQELVQAFEEEQILVYPTEPFWADKSRCGNQLIFGFGSLPLSRLPKAMDAVARVIERLP